VATEMVRCLGPNGACERHQVAAEPPAVFPAGSVAHTGVDNKVGVWDRANQPVLRLPRDEGVGVTPDQERLGDTCPVAGAVPGTTIRYASPPAEPLPPAVWWVGGLPAWRAISAASGLTALLGSPPRPRVAGRLLIGGQRPPAAGLTLAWPSGVTGRANPCVGRAPEPTRSCGREHAPAGRVPGDSARTATTVERQADAERHAACNDQRADDAQDVRADPHSAPPRSR